MHKDGADYEYKVFDWMEGDEEAELSLFLTPVKPNQGEEGSGKPEGGEEMQATIHDLARSELRRPVRCMEVNHEEVKYDKEKEDKGSRPDLGRQRVQGCAEVPVELETEGSIAKSTAGIDSSIPWKDVPLTDDRDEECQYERTQSGSKEEDILSGRH